MQLDGSLRSVLWASKIYTALARSLAKTPAQPPAAAQPSTTPPASVASKAQAEVIVPSPACGGGSPKATRQGGAGGEGANLLRLALRGAAVGAVLLSMVLHHVLAVAGTDWRRDGDCAVVLGAAVRDNGRPSDALRDRVHTAAKLYRQGKVRRLLMTGGTGPNGRSEPQAMRDLAVSYGVPASAILLDEGGHNTAASLHNLALLTEQHQLGRLLVVSHGHHTARIRLGCHRLGLTCATVPAEQDRPLRKEAWFVTREVLGFAAYVVVFR